MLRTHRNSQPLNFSSAAIKLSHKNACGQDLDNAQGSWWSYIVIQKRLSECCFVLEAVGAFAQVC